MNKGEKAKVFVYGSGGRDHCLAVEYAESSHVGKVYIGPGTPGIDNTKQAHSGWIERVPIEDFGEVARFCEEKGVNLVDVGSEKPLEEGLIDVLNNVGIPTVGPKAEYVRLESDRAFTDRILRNIGVPKPEFRVFEDPVEAKRYIRGIGYQVVVKANGLAAGKGAIVCDDKRDAEAAIDTIMVERKFGDSGKRVVIEERKYGTEVSFYAYLDGEHVLPLRVFTHDDKLAFDPDQKVEMFHFHYGFNERGIRRGLHELGINPTKNIESIHKHEREMREYLTEALQKARLPNLNTGGMVCYCPHRLNSPWLTNRIIREVVNPTVNAVYKMGNYKGVLYFGLNIDPRGNLWVYEVNVRHGDPEAQVLLRKLKTDLFEIGMATWEGKLDQLEDEWNSNHYVDIAATTGKSKDEKGGWYPGYPGRYGKGYKITGLDQIEKGVAIFYAGVEEHSKRGLVTRGGRVLHVVASSPESLDEARVKALRNVVKLKFLDHNDDNKNCLRHRKTIGQDYNTLYSPEQILHGK